MRLFTLWALLPLALAANDSATAEVDILWPLEGETFSLNSKGMGAIFALQNYPEAQKHGWSLNWEMCMPRSDIEGRQECAFYEALYNKSDPSDANAPTILQNGEDDGAMHIELGHSYWYSNSKGQSSFNANLSGVYNFKWNFNMGPYCTRNGTYSEYGLGWGVASGSFDVTVDATAAPLPTMTTATCASFLGAVSYTSSISDWSFQQSVDNKPTCVGTASVTKSPEPCRATLDAAQIGTVRSIMGWDQADATATPTSTPTATGAGSGQAQTTNAAGSIELGVVAVCLFCLVTLLA